MAEVSAAEKARKAAIKLHDRVNLFLVPPLVFGCCAGCVPSLQWLADPYAVTVGFAAYIALDTVWLLVEPRAIPSLYSVVLVHHLVTAGLLSHPLRYPEQAIYTCINGTVELNTLILVLRRNTTGVLNAVLNVLYWATTVGIRLGVVPYLLWHLYYHMQKYPPQEFYIVVCSQTFLCVFNVGLTVFQIMKMKQRAAKAAKAK